MKSREYTITLTDYMKQYQSDNDIKTKITSVEPLNKNQLKNSVQNLSSRQILKFMLEQKMSNTSHVL